MNKLIKLTQVFSNIYTSDSTRQSQLIYLNISSIKPISVEPIYDNLTYLLIRDKINPIYVQESVDNILIQLKYLGVRI